MAATDPRALVLASYESLNRGEVGAAMDGEDEEDQLQLGVSARIGPDPTIGA